MRKFLTASIAALALLGTIAAGSSVTSPAVARGDGDWPLRAIKG